MTDSKRTPLEDKWAATLDQEPDGDTSGDTAPDGEAGEVPQHPLEAEVAELKDQLLRQQAEMANYRRRTQQERDERAVEGRIDVIQQLLPVLDDFERAIDADADADGYREGVELILKSLRDLLVSLGVSRLDPHGEEFDPTLHDAVQQLPTDEVPEGRVASVYKPGYQLGERLLRPATVVVARQPMADPEPEV
ncbi:MAG TPA: nucleotide exchange factor GrpE [Acidobacteriota bacterium]|nr:nucleotide exchange factor GrpE [Acidobacteriota bacterium]